MRIRKWIVAALCVVLAAALLAAALRLLPLKKAQEQPEREYDCVIGVIFFGTPESTNILSNTVFRYASYLETSFNVKFRFASTLQMSHLEAVEKLCEEGVDVILNASTQSIPEGLSVCEEYGVYWLQILDMTTDTDIIEKAMSSDNFLGYIASDDGQGARELADRMLDAGKTSIGVVAYPETLATSDVHTVRCNAIQDTIIEYDPSEIEFVLEISSVNRGLESMAAQGYRPDGLVFTTSTESFTTDELKELFSTPEMKMAHFDLNSKTRMTLYDGDCVAVACGQQNIIGLAFAYAYHYVTSDYRSDQKLQLKSDYVILTNAEEYDSYMKYCVYSFPYSDVELKSIITSLDSTTDVLADYANRYSLNDVLSRREGD